MNGESALLALFEQTWAGLGKEPRWLAAKLKSGKT
jgi:DNA-binding protein H-NS